MLAVAALATLAAADTRPRVLVISFSDEEVNASCATLAAGAPGAFASCRRWPAIRLSSLHDDRVVEWSGGGAIEPAVGANSLGNLGAGLAHLTAWRHVAADTAFQGATLIMEGDEAARRAQAPLVASLLSNQSFLHRWDLLYLNVLRPFGLAGEPGVPPGMLRVPAHALLQYQNHYNVWTSAYALQPHSASQLLAQLCVAHPDLSVKLLDVWLTGQLKQPSQKVRTYAWDTTNELFAHGDETSSDRRKNNGGMYYYILMVYDALLKDFVEGVSTGEHQTVGITINDDPTIQLPRFDRPSTAEVTSFDSHATQCHVEPQQQCPLDMSALVDHGMPCVGEELPEQTGPTEVKLGFLGNLPFGEDAVIKMGMSEHDLFHNASAALGTVQPRPCARMTPKIVHFMWIFSKVRPVHATRIAEYALKNPEWRVLLWVDRVEQSDESLMALANASSRAAGPVELMLLQDYAPCMRNTVLQPDRSITRSISVHGFDHHTNPTNLLRLEVVYLFGGIYTDTDSVAARGFDEYGDIFRAPFAVVVKADSCNCMFGADRGSDLLRVALEAANHTIPSLGAPMVGGTGPSFWTGVLLAYQPTDWLIMHWSSTLYPTPEAVVYQLWEGSWNSMHTGLVDVCHALGIETKVPISPDEFNGAGQDACRAFENGLRRNWPWLVVFAVALLGACCWALRKRHRRGLPMLPCPSALQLRAICAGTAYSLLFCLSSTVLIMLQKLLISYRGFAFPMTLALNGMLVSSLGSALLTFCTPWAPRQVACTRHFALTRCAPLGLLSALGLYLGNRAYMDLSISFMQMMRAGTPVIILGLSFAAKIKKPSFSLVGSVTIIGLGTLLVAVGEVYFVWVGVLAMIGAMLCEASRLVLMELSINQHGTKLGPLEGLLYFSPFACLCLFVGVLALELGDLIDHGFGLIARFPFVFLVHALLGFAVNLLTVLLVKQTSGISFKMISTARNVGIVLISVPLFHNPISGLQCLGYLVANMGLGWYTSANIKSAPRSEADLEEKVSLSRQSLEPPSGSRLAAEMRPVATVPDDEMMPAGGCEYVRWVCLRHLKLGYLLLQWLFFSCAIILFNREVISADGFDFGYPVTLVLCHMVVSFCLMHALKVAKVVQVTPIDRSLWVRKFLPVGLAFAISLWLSNAAYLFISVAFIQMIKASTPVAVLLGSFALGLEAPTYRLFAYILTISIGIGTACFGQSDPNFVGALIQFSAIFAEALRLCLINKLLVAEGIKFNAVSTLYYMAPACAICLLPAWLIFSGEFGKLVAVGFAPVFENIGIPLLMLNSSVAVALTLSSIALISYTSALTMNIAGVFKDLLLILWSVAMSGAVVTTTQYMGYTIAVIGVWCYSTYKRAQQAAKAKAAKAAESLSSGREMSERGLTEGEDGETLSDELAPECTPALHETVELDEDVKAVRVPLSRAA